MKRKDVLVIFGLFVLIIALLILNSSANVFLSNLQTTAIQTTQVTINELTITADVAKTPQTRSRGLSQRESLPAGNGMLFVFEKEGRYGFWMKDMKFPIDIIWIDKEKKIADITPSAKPEPETPKNLLRIYKPAEPVLYVLEVPAGAATSNNLKIGDEVEFTL